MRGRQAGMIGAAVARNRISASGIWSTSEQLLEMKTLTWPFTNVVAISPMPTVRFSSSNLGILPNGSSLTSLINYGSGGSSYNASPSSGYPPIKQTFGGFPAIYFDGQIGGNYRSLQMATAVNGSTSASLFMVGSVAGNSRIVGFGGLGADGKCYFGYDTTNNTNFYYRNTVDNGLTLTVSAVSGLKAFGIVISSGTAYYFDNSTSYTSVSLAVGSYFFQKLGARDWGQSTDNQSSYGYLTESIFYDSALSLSDAASVMTQLKNTYAIA